MKKGRRDVRSGFLGAGAVCQERWRNGDAIEMGREDCSRGASGIILRRLKCRAQATEWLRLFSFAKARFSFRCSNVLNPRAFCEAAMN